MTKDTADQLIQFLATMAHQSREQGLKLKALERLANNRPDVFQDYQNYLEELRGNPITQKSHDNIVEALDKLRTALRQE
jgi:hypothetical protein